MPFGTLLSVADVYSSSSLNIMICNDWLCKAAGQGSTELCFIFKRESTVHRVHACLRHEGYPESRLLFDDGGRPSECGCFPSGRPPSCILCRIRTKTVDEFDEEFHHEKICWIDLKKIKYHNADPLQHNSTSIWWLSNPLLRLPQKVNDLITFTILVNRTVTCYFVLFRFGIFAVTKIPEDVTLT